MEKGENETNKPGENTKEVLAWWVWLIIVLTIVGVAAGAGYYLDKKRIEAENGYQKANTVQTV